MFISAVQQFTLIDYPDHIACIIFTAGCNFRCGYCHNPEFVLPEEIKKIKSSFIKEDVVVNFLEKRKGLLDGVVISGGEPTVQADLERFIRRVKGLGYKVKLDTNGNNPNLLAHLIDSHLVDYIAMDIKTDLLSYKSLCRGSCQPEYIQQSIEIIKDSSVPFEFRSTLVKGIHSHEILTNMAKLLGEGDLLYLQRFRPQKTLCKGFQKYTSFDSSELADIEELFNSFGIKCSIR